ncbi:Hypothetical protein AJAP_06980 [Amycolatopsis japonica]|uniref:Uncharacterized protein n=1 Tax=Amycolatopsis japonica TaxID=208439 RepID=A0A075UN54_9PSEU|nr:Hypothetical protein AJAP_06980 [Amycolatopsis japonica]
MKRKGHLSRVDTRKAAFISLTTYRDHQRSETSHLSAPRHHAANASPRGKYTRTEHALIGVPGN